MDSGFAAPCQWDSDPSHCRNGVATVAGSGGFVAAMAELDRFSPSDMEVGNFLLSLQHSLKTSRSLASCLHACNASSTLRSPPVLKNSHRRLLPSTCVIPCRRFATSLADGNARLADKLAVALSLLGALTPNTDASWPVALPVNPYFAERGAGIPTLPILVGRDGRQAGIERRVGNPCTQNAMNARCS